MPHPATVDPYRQVGQRSWIVSPTAGPLTRVADLRGAYLEARADAAETAEDAEVLR